MLSCCCNVSVHDEHLDFKAIQIDIYTRDETSCIESN